VKDNPDVLPKFPRKEDLRDYSEMISKEEHIYFDFDKGIVVNDLVDEKEVKRL